MPNLTILKNLAKEFPPREFLPSSWSFLKILGRTKYDVNILKPDSFLHVNKKYGRIIYISWKVLWCKLAINVVVENQWLSIIDNISPFFLYQRKFVDRYPDMLVKNPEYLLEH